MNNDIESDGYDLSLEELRRLEIEDLREYTQGIKRRYRLQIKFEGAIREYKKALEVYFESLHANSGITYAEISFLEYELGTIEFLKCNFDQAVKFFEDSAKHAALQGDQVRDEIGRFRVIHAKTYAENIDFKIAYEDMQNCLGKLVALNQEDGSDLCDRWIYNIQIHLFDLAVDMGNAEEAQFRFDQYIEAPLTVVHLEKDPPSKQSLLQMHSIQGRLFYVKNEYDKALENFAVFLDFDFSEWGKKDEELARNSKNFQHMAREYLLAGKMLKAKGLNDRAVDILNAGLELNPLHGNLCFQKKIQAELNP